MATRNARKKPSVKVPSKSFDEAVEFLDRVHATAQAASASARYSSSRLPYPRSSELFLPPIPPRF